MTKAESQLNKNTKRSQKSLQNIALGALTAAILSACGGGGGCCTVPPTANSELTFVAPSILPSLANKTGVNYMGVYNPSSVAISGISYSVGEQVGSGTSVSLDPASVLACATIPAKSSCYLKLSVPESTIAGGTVVTATDSNGLEAATPLAIGVQQVPYTESANANGVGLYFYPKAQYTESGVPFILVTAVVQSPNVGTINTIELVDESGNVIPNQLVTSGNSGAGKAALTMGDVVEIALPLPQGANLTQNIKVQTSYQTLATATVTSLAERLNLKSPKAGTNSSVSTATYTLTTQSNNINLQLTPGQVYLTQTNPTQYGYLYNIGDLTASQITLTSSSPNVKVTAADAILNGQRVIKVTYELINASVAPTTNTVLVTGTNPSGQTQTTTGNTNQNVNPDVVPTPSPAPTPTPTPTPGPPPPPPPTPTWSMVGGSIVDDSLYSAVIAVDGNNVYAGGETSSSDGRVWQYNGTSWNLQGGALPSSKMVNSMVVDNGILYAGGQASVNSVYGGGVWKYENNAWSLVGGGLVTSGGTNGNIISILVKNSFIYAGGARLNGSYTGGVWEYDGSSWNLVTGSLISGSYFAFSIAFDSSDNIYAGGTMSSMAGPGGVWTGSPWALANGVDIPSAIGVASIAIDSSDNVYVCGYTSSPAAAVWKYDSGTGSWAMLGGNTIPNSKYCNSIALSGGNVYTTGQTDTDTAILWKYDGSSWSSVGGAIPDSTFGNSLVISNGVFYVGGRTPSYKGAVWQYK